MQPTDAGARWGRPSTLVATLAGSAALILASQIVQSHNNTGEVVVPQEHPTGHVHDHADQTWPPQPRGATGIVNFSKPGVEQERRQKLQQRFADLEQRAAARPDFKQALGQRFRRIAVVDQDDKAGISQGNRFIYFSYDKNATVEMLFDGAALRSVKSIPASDYQPEITEEEIAEATELARKYFLGLGITRVQQLKGYGILAYRPEGKGFYEGRVIYISFHVGDDTPPEFAAWVDLTSQAVLRYREER